VKKGGVKTLPKGRGPGPWETPVKNQELGLGTIEDVGKGWSRSVLAVWLSPFSGFGAGPAEH